MRLYFLILDNESGEVIVDWFRINGVTSFLNFCNKKLVWSISERTEGNQIKLDTLIAFREGAVCKICNSITSNYRVIPLPNFYTPV